MPTLITCTGVATAGKDEFCDCLVRDHGYVKLSWSDKLFQMACAVDPLVRVRLSDMFANGWIFPFQRLSTIIDAYGYTKAKRIPSVRQFLQILGTEGGRNVLGDRVWVDAMLPKVRDLLANGYNVCITNTRFANEAKEIINLGGYVVQVKRPGVDAVNDHCSDAGDAIDFATMLVVNAGTKDDLAKSATKVHTELSKANTETAPKPPKADYEDFVDALCKPGWDIINSLEPSSAHLWHMATGVSGEAGELLDAIKKHVVYCKPLDRENVVEELGDLEFYMQGIRNVLDISRDHVLHCNREKLAARYSEGYSDQAAQDREDKNGCEE